ncbi:hypothetical protein DUI87_01542 [Hirundo rustica rustica]|uniref:RNase H type-1 domain-containing protein n=1 Tax=Hirundo rustica rustica TaxID=333673 RepID=A0A3M0LCB5_HIRRU|nr:hypothetical protein DUI87_01542 [Hirundo rustica rustica]
MGQDHICLSATLADNPLMTCLVGIPNGPKELPTKLLEITEQTNREGASKGQKRSYQFVYQTKDVYTAKIWCGQIAHVEMASTTDRKPLALPRDEEVTRQATLQNRAAIDYLLLLHGHRYEEFEELCCFNLLMKAEDVHKTIQSIRGMVQDIKKETGDWLSGMFGNWGISGWQGIALGILAQDLGPYRRAVTYFSKQLDAAAKGWPGCLRSTSAVAVNIQEARKFTLGQKMTVLVSHTVSAVLEVKEGHWLSPQRFLKYQAILVEQDDVEIVVTNIVNPASFLSGSMGEPVIHDCLEAIKVTYSSRLDLKDTLLENAETWITDGSSYVISGRHAGYVVTTSREVIESGPLTTNTSAQKAEVTALTLALELAKGKKVNIYMGSRYALWVVHAHGAIWKERGLLNSQGKSIKRAQEIIKLLEAVQLPEKVAIMHIKAHQKVSSELEEGNKLADRKAKEAAKGEVIVETVEAALIPYG